MDNKICHLIKDLLPLYADDVVSPETAESIRVHLESCESCREEYAQLTRELTLPANPKAKEADSQVLKQFRRRWQRQNVGIFLVSLMVTLIVTLALVVFGFLALREFIFESEIFNPKKTATLWQVDTEDQWQDVSFEEGEAYMEFDSMFYEKELILSAMSSDDLEFRIINSEGDVVLGPQTLKAGAAVDLDFLEDDVSYILEIRAAGEYFQLTYR